MSTPLPFPDEPAPERPLFTDEQKAAAEAQIVEQSRRIDFFLTEYSVELLVQKLSNGDFEIPTYQRADTWEHNRKSRFIESVLIGLPIPFLIFWESSETGKLEIVDGSQRLRSLQQFTHGDLVLSDLETLTELEGMRFSDLMASRQKKIKNRSIRGIVLNEHADEQARFEIFDRVNTGSKIANKAEVRRGALVGPFLDLVIDLAKLPLFTKLAPFPQKDINLREREELVTRFFAYGDGLEEYRDRPSEFLFQYAKRTNQLFQTNPERVQEYRDRFINTMKFVEIAFPYGFRRNENGKDTPRTRFEAIAIGSYLALQKRPSLTGETLNVLPWLEGKPFQRVIGSDGANAVSRLRARIDFVRNKLVRG